MRFFLLIPLVMLIGDALWWRRADALLAAGRRRPLWRVALGVFMAAQLLGLLWVMSARMLTHLPESATPAPIVAAVYLWHLLILPFILLAWLAALLAALPQKIVRIARAHPAAASPDAPPASGAVSRRQVLGVAAAAVPPALTGLGVAISHIEIERFHVRSLQVPIADLPRDLDGLRIAHVSDIHVGRFSSERLLRKIVEQTNRLDADLVLLTGDLINSSLSDLPDGIAAVKNMQSRYGTYMCLGNHDLMDNPWQFVREVGESGIPLLVDQARRLRVRGQPLQLLGLPWTRGDESISASVGRLLRQREPDAFPILLAHHPHAFDPAAAAGLPLTLAGHTHGGQLMLSDRIGVGPLMFRYWSGLYEKPQRQKLIVSNGVGNWFPLRTHAPAEILDITLRRDA